MVSSSSLVGTCQDLWGDDEVSGEDEGGVWDDDGGVQLEDAEATGSDNDKDDKELDDVCKLDLVTQCF